MSFFCPVFWQSLILIYFWVKLIFNICSLFLIFAYYDSQVSLENLLLDTIVSPWWAFGVQIINCVQQIGNDLYICASCCWPSYYQYFLQSWYDLWSTNKPMLDLWLFKLQTNKCDLWDKMDLLFKLDLNKKLSCLIDGGINYFWCVFKWYYYAIWSVHILLPIYFSHALSFFF